MISTAPHSALVALLLTGIPGYMANTEAPVSVRLRLLITCICGIGRGAQSRARRGLC